MLHAMHKFPQCLLHVHGVECSPDDEPRDDSFSLLCYECYFNSKPSSKKSSGGIYDEDSKRDYNIPTSQPTDVNGSLVAINDDISKLM